MYRIPSPWSEIANLICGTLLLLALVGIFVFVGYRKSRAKNQKAPYNDELNTANIEQIFACMFTVFLVFFSMKKADIQLITAGFVAISMGAYYLLVCRNHTTGITANPSNTVKSLVIAVAGPVAIAFIGSPFVLGNILFWSMFPWAQRYYFDKGKDPKIPPPKDVDVEQA